MRRRDTAQLFGSTCAESYDINHQDLIKKCELERQEICSTKLTKLSEANGEH